MKRRKKKKKKSNREKDYGRLRSTVENERKIQRKRKMEKEG